MILVDYSGVSLSPVFLPNVPIEIDILRHMILNSIRGYMNKYGNKYGELVICCDAGNNWRREVYPEYKGNRKEDREKSSLDYDKIFSITNQIRDEIKNNFPYKVLQVDGCECDDIIGELVRSTQDFGMCEDVLIVSADKDFRQLQKYSNVRQWSTSTKKFIDVKNPHKDLFEHIVRGDSGDGVPNMLSGDKSLLEGVRQKSIYQKKIDLWYDSRSNLEAVLTTEEYRNFSRNKKMIDLDQTPEHLKSEIMEQFNSQNPSRNRSKIFPYLMKHKCSQLLGKAQEFV